VKFLLLFLLLFNSLSALTYAEEEQYNKWASEQRKHIQNQALYNKKNSYKNHPLYPEYLKYLAKKKDEKLKKEIVIGGIVISSALLILFLFYKFLKYKFIPFVDKHSNSKKMFRLFTIISLLWVIGVLLTTIINMRHKWFFSAEMYVFIFVGLLPPSLFWSYYWIKSAKD